MYDYSHWCSPLELAENVLSRAQLEDVRVAIANAHDGAEVAGRRHEHRADGGIHDLQIGNITMNTNIINMYRKVCDIIFSVSSLYENSREIHPPATTLSTPASAD